MARGRGLGGGWVPGGRGYPIASLRSLQEGAGTQAGVLREPAEGGQEHHWLTDGDQQGRITGGDELRPTPADHQLGSPPPPPAPARTSVSAPSAPRAAAAGATATPTAPHRLVFIENKKPASPNDPSAHRPAARTERRPPRRCWGSPAMPCRARSGSQAASPALLFSPASHAPRFTPASPAVSWSCPAVPSHARGDPRCPVALPGAGACPSTRSHPACPPPRTGQASLRQRSLQMGRKENWPRFCTSFLSKLKGCSSIAACRGFLLPAAGAVGAQGSQSPGEADGAELRGLCTLPVAAAIPSSTCPGPRSPLPGAAPAAGKQSAEGYGHPGRQPHGTGTA